ncbi:glycosyltransferase [Herbidospora sp. NEAU-GS84]|uniref:Glycosyltransferase n=1 Tax=Herbidospora solisilvae TaxID=2696284 RepID=A0A7C9NIA8_9ACTN|nr:glycosyltransferase [Herbidospora solisilvae]
MPRGHDELPNGLACADLMAAPAVNENFGMVYIEAAACGVPPVATPAQGVATGIKRGDPVLAGDWEGSGRSRGGFGTKIHLAADGGCRPLSFLLTAGQGGDGPQMTAVLDRIRVPRMAVGRPRTRPVSVAADKACSSRGNRSYRRPRKIRHTIPEPADQKRIAAGAG